MACGLTLRNAAAQEAFHGADTQLRHSFDPQLHALQIEHIARSEIASTRDLSATGFDEKRIRLFVKRLPPIFEHGPEKWSPVFGRHHVQT